jgi:RNA polymerase-interacting CarD/CdnL/TRCF family regulator
MVKTLSKQRFTGAETRQYYEVINERITVWVPIDEHGQTVLRQVASKDSLKGCRRLLKSAPVPLSKNPHIRKSAIAHRLENRLLPALCRIVRDLTAESRRKPLSVTEGELLRRTFRALCDEWAAAEGVTIKTALGEIESLLKSPSPTQTSGMSI